MTERKNNQDSETEKLRNKIKAAFFEKEPKKSAMYEDTEKDLNAKILQITLMISEQFPELSKYVKELPVTILEEKNPESVKKNLKNYYDTLGSILNKYKLEHPYKTKQ